MTKDQMKKLFSSNIFLLSSRAKAEDNIEEFYREEMERGANVLFAPDFHICASNMEPLFRTVQSAGETAFSTCLIRPPECGISLYGGDYQYKEYYEEIKQQATLCYEAGVSFLLLGGFSNLTEAKLAVFAAKEACPLPLCVGLRFNDEIKLAGGIDAAMAILTLQTLGVSAVGVLEAENADDALEALSQMKEFSSVPLFALPNVSEFMTPEDYADYMPEYINCKCAMVGTFNGDARYTAAISKALWQTEPFLPDFHEVHAITGPGGILFYDFKNQTVSENKLLLEIEIEDEKTVVSAIDKLIKAKTPPVCFKSKDLDALVAAVQLYPGRPAVRSDEYGEIAAKENGALVLPEGV
ncbi:MAG: homocysteine S-methyltransferase family protein [Clostridia bacterium]|nr:homocysteine S-methyltransferase family protein [Clostridia bacterium]